MLVEQPFTKLQKEQLDAIERQKVHDRMVAVTEQGKLPSTEQLASSLENAAQRAEEVKERRDLSCTGKQLVSNTQKLLSATQEAIQNKNAGNELQQLIYHGTQAVRKFTDESSMELFPEAVDSQQASEMAAKARDAVHASMGIARLLGTSADFRQELVEAIDIAQDFLGHVSERVSSGQSATEVAEEVKEEAKEKAKHAEEEMQEKSKDDRYRLSKEQQDQLLDRILKITKQAQASQEYQEAMSLLMDAVSGLYDQTSSIAQRCIDQARQTDIVEEPRTSGTIHPHGCAGAVAPCAERDVPEDRLNLRERHETRPQRSGPEIEIKGGTYDTKFPLQSKSADPSTAGIVTSTSKKPLKTGEQVSVEHVPGMSAEIHRTPFGQETTIKVNRSGPEELAMAMHALRKFVENLTGSEGSLQPLMDAFQNLTKTIADVATAGDPNASERKKKQHAQTVEYLHKLRDFIERMVRDPDSCSSGKDLREYFTNEIYNPGYDILVVPYRRPTKRFLREVNSFLERTMQDESAQRLTEGASAIASGLFLDPETKKPRFKPELLNDMTVLIPVIMEAMKYIPVPRIENLEDPDMDFILDNMVFRATNLAPKLFNFVNEMKYDEKNGSRSMTMLRIARIHTDAKNIQFFYNKKTGFPHMKDEGLMDLRIYDKGLDITVTLYPHLVTDAVREEFERHETEATVSGLNLAAVPHQSLSSTGHPITASTLINSAPVVYSKDGEVQEAAAQVLQKKNEQETFATNATLSPAKLEEVLLDAFNVDVKVHKIDVRLHESKHDVLYKIMSGFIKRSVRKRIEHVIHDQIIDMVKKLPDLAARYAGIDYNESIMSAAGIVSTGTGEGTSDKVTERDIAAASGAKAKILPEWGSSAFDPAQQQVGICR